MRPVAWDKRQLLQKARSRRRSFLLGRFLVLFHPALLVSIALWLFLVLFSLPFHPPFWAFLLLPFVTCFVLIKEARSGLIRMDEITKMDGLLVAALEVDQEHPFSNPLAVRASRALDEKSPSKWGRKVLFQRRSSKKGSIGLLYAMLAFLLVFQFQGVMPLPLFKGSIPNPPSSFTQEQAKKGGTGCDSCRPKDGKGKKQRETNARKKADERENPIKRTMPKPVPFLGWEDLLMAPPPMGEGPKHKKKIHSLQGEKRLSKGEDDSKSDATPPQGKRKKQIPNDRVKRLKAFKRAAEKAMGDGFLTQGEAWVAVRQLEGWKKQ